MLNHKGILNENMHKSIDDYNDNKSKCITTIMLRTQILIYIVWSDRSNIKMYFYESLFDKSDIYDARKVAYEN